MYREFSSVALAIVFLVKDRLLHRHGYSLPRTRDTQLTMIGHEIQ